MFDLKQELSRFSYFDIESLLAKKPDMPDHIKNSLTLYNKALESLKNGSEDIAIIELKKAVSLNPGFHEAMNLLGVCYYYTKNMSKAKELFERVVEEEKNSITAMEYLKILNPDYGVSQTGPAKSKPTKSKPVKKEGSGTEVFKNWILSLNKIGRVDAIKYSMFFIAGALVVFLISLQFYFKDGDDAVVDTSVRVSTQDPGKVDEESYKKKYEALLSTHNALKKESELFKNQGQNFKSSFMLLEIEKMLDDKKYESAADKLLLIKSHPLQGIEKEKYEKLCNTAMPKAAHAVVESGLSLKRQKKYQDAITKFNKVQAYGDKANSLDAAWYYIGECYMAMEDSRSAINYFMKIKETYPKSRYVYYADKMIRLITQKA